MNPEQRQQLIQANSVPRQEISQTLTILSFTMLGAFMSVRLIGAGVDGVDSGVILFLIWFFVCGVVSGLIAGLTARDAVGHRGAWGLCHAMIGAVLGVFVGTMLSSVLLGPALIGFFLVGPYSLLIGPKFAVKIMFEVNELAYLFWGWIAVTHVIMRLIRGRTI